MKKLVAGNRFVYDADIGMSRCEDSFRKVNERIVTECRIAEHHNTVCILALAQNVYTAKKRHKITSHRAGSQAKLFRGTKRRLIDLRNLHLV